MLDMGSSGLYLCCWICFGGCTFALFEANALGKDIHLGWTEYAILFVCSFLLWPIIISFSLGAAFGDFIAPSSDDDDDDDDDI